MGDAQTRRELFGLRFNEVVEGLLAPIHEALGRFLLLDAAQLLLVAASLHHGFVVLDFMLGRLGEHAAFVIEARTARATGDLVELARTQAAHFVAVEFRELRENHGMDGHVNAHAQRVGAANYRQKALLGELFDKQAIARQHARMVHAHAKAEQALERFAECSGKRRALHGFLDRLALRLGGNAVARKRARRRERGVLGEMHQIHGAFASPQGELDCSLDWRFHVFIGKRHGARGVHHAAHRIARLALQRRSDFVDVAKRGAHQQKLRFRKCEQRHLPRPATIEIAEIMELVGRHRMHLSLGALAKREVRENLGRAANHGRIDVDMHVAGNHAHVVTAKQFDQVEEFLAHERLDRRRVIGALAEAHSHKMHAKRHERFARTGRRAQNHVIAHHNVHESFLLVRPQLNAARLAPLHECHERLFGRGVFVIELVGDATKLAVGGGCDFVGLNDFGKIFRMSV